MTLGALEVDDLAAVVQYLREEGTVRGYRKGCAVVFATVLLPSCSSRAEHQQLWLMFLPVNADGKMAARHGRCRQHQHDWALGALHGGCYRAAVQPAGPLHRRHGGWQLLQPSCWHWCCAAGFLPYWSRAAFLLPRRSLDAAVQPTLLLQVLDSPFSRLVDLMMELATDQQLRIPKPLLKVRLLPLRWWGGV